jgi:hypothetical protein
VNFFGINSAPVNGSAFVVVLGAALIAGSSGAQAVPTNTTPGAANTVTVTANVTATGVRNVFGGGQSSTVSTSIAQWVLATTASAGIRVTAEARATNTDAYGIATSSGAATGTKVLPGAASGSAYSGATASGDRTAGTPALAIVTAWTAADASVKRSGQTTTERDGYAFVPMTAIVTAGGEKTTLGTAIGNAYVTATADATKIHGGQAAVVCSLTITATGANDTAVASTTSTVTAKPTLTMFSAATASSTAVVPPVDSVVSRSGGMCVATGTSVMTAGGRLALQGAGATSFASSATANGRLALQGAARPTASSAATAYANVTRFAESRSALVATSLTAAGIVADAIANPATPAPFNRTMRVAAESRAMRVAYENRTMRVVE